MNPPAERRFPTLKRKNRPKTARLAMLLAYDGAGYRGFQRQPGQRTVEGELVDALTRLGLSGGLSFASRTDAGVHADGQVVAFRAPEGNTPEALRDALEALFPPDLRIRALRPAPAKFHPRWTAVGKSYRYVLSATPLPRSWQPGPLDGERLHRALEALRSALRLDGFTAAGAPAKDAPPLERLEAREADGRIDLTFVGPAFRRYAIRHMVGAAVACAQGALAVEDVARIAVDAPPYRGLRAPGDGLLLETVHYPPGLDPFA